MTLKTIADYTKLKRNTECIKYDGANLDKVIESHELWVGTNGREGRWANFCSCNLDGEELRHADLRGASFLRTHAKNTDFEHSDLSFAVFEDADISYSKFRGATLKSASLSNAEAAYSDFSFAEMRDTYCLYGNFKEAMFYDATIDNAFFDHANLKDAVFDRAQVTATFEGTQNIPWLPMYCPEEGSFIAWKKCDYYIDNEPTENCIVKLLIPEDAKRSSALTSERKCRASAVKVLEIQDMEGNKLPDDTIARSMYDWRVTYKVGETLYEPRFDTNRWKVCAPGLHFFMSRHEAETYVF